MNVRKFLGLVVTAAGILIVALALGAMGHQTAGAAGTPTHTIVDNLPTNPVPVTGNVQATGTVSIGGTPTVEVTNSSARPVLVKNVDQPRSTPFQQQVYVSIAVSL